MFIQRRKEHVSSVDIGIFFDSSLSAKMQYPLFCGKKKKQSTAGQFLSLNGHSLGLHTQNIT